MLLRVNWIIGLNWIIRCQSTFSDKMKGKCIAFKHCCFHTFSTFNIFHLSRAAQILEKWESEKRTSFSTLRAPVPTDLGFVVFDSFFSLKCILPRPKQNRWCIFILFKYFLNNLFLTVFVQNVTSKFVKVLLQKLNNSLLEKSQARFCAAAC